MITMSGEANPDTVRGITGHPTVEAQATVADRAVVAEATAAVGATVEATAVQAMAAAVDMAGDTESVKATKYESQW